MEPIRRFHAAPAGSFFLLGPHGSGKSHWLRATFPHATSIDLDDSAVERRLRTRPEALESLIGSRPKAGPIIVDGVDRVPALVDVARRLAARHKGWRFVLAGSSAKAVKRDRLNIFGKRWPRLFMHPFVAGELGRRFKVAEAMRLGTVPAVLDDPRPALARTDYYEYFFRRKVKAEKLVPQYERYREFLDVVSMAHAAQLDVASLAKACELDRKIVAGYLGVLEELFLVERLEPFTRRARRALFTQPKLYVFDAGVYRALPPVPEQDDQEVEDAALEGLVYQHLAAWCAWAPGAQRSLGFFRARAGWKVDFVVQSRDEFVAIDVQNAFAIDDDALEGVESFLADYPGARAIVLYRGQERVERGRVLCVPVDDFLPRLHPSRSVSVAARQG